MNAIRGARGFALEGRPLGDCLAKAVAPVGKAEPGWLACWLAGWCDQPAALANNKSGRRVVLSVGGVSLVGRAPLVCRVNRRLIRLDRLLAFGRCFEGAATATAVVSGSSIGGIRGIREAAEAAAEATGAEAATG